MHAAHLRIRLHRLLLRHDALHVLSEVVLVVGLRKPGIWRQLHRLLHGGQLFESGR